MYPTGHYGISLLLFSPILAALFILNLPIIAMVSIVIIILTAPFPDIDLKFPLRYLIAHRTWTHSFWFALLVGLFTGSAFITLAPIYETIHPNYLFAYGMFIGMYGIFGHVAGDILTHSGVQFFYPFGPRFSLHLTSAKGLWWFENPKSGNQEELTLYEGFRHKILNSNRVFLVIGLISSGLASTLYSFN